MALTTKREQRILKLYRALTKKNKYVAKLYGDRPPQDPLQRHSIAYGNTFLHMAIRFRQFKLVDLLLETLPESLSHITNDDGDTILHELAAKDDSAKRARKAVDKDPELLIALNKLKETPIFSAARHNRFHMFRLLAEELKQHYPEDVKKHLQRDGKTTVLHVAITAEHFELACEIAKSHQDLIVEKDEGGMTAFQNLACNQRAFSKKKKRREGFLEDNATGRKMMKNAGDIFTEAFFDPFRLVGAQIIDDALQSLVEILVTKDTIWLNSQEIGSCNSKEPKGGIMESKRELSQKKNNEESHGRDIPRKESTKVEKREKSNMFKKNDESPLFLAVMSNIPEIVEEIIIQHPFVLEHVNKEGMNILQVAILYGHVKIFDLVVNLKVLPNGLLSVLDDGGNSLAHMVSQSKSSQATERMQNPAMQLQKECRFFKKVKSACNMHLIKPLNNNHETADELFVAANEELHQKGKDWLLRTTENCTILSVFVATVAFAAAYTVPGGPNQNTGIPLLNSKPWFMVFIIADVISLTLALTSVGIFLSILTSSFPLQDFETYLFQKLKRGIISLILSVSMMAVAFGATVVLIMTQNWENAVWIVVGFLPVPIFFLSYSPLCSTALEPFIEVFTTFAAKFLFVLVVVLFVGQLLLSALLFYLPLRVFTGLRWIVRIVNVGKNQISQSRQPSQV